ncbi:IS3 family transposase [Periweissella cryptocerci]|uniref:IS3 family transposase n=1 Tax=Periweissella cryptocerci TaxID=2506420 RepID=UPI001FAA6EFF|nr:IS3 family transposase [Periweissella cryptocerci]
MTYVKTVRDGWTYLASVIDMHSRRIIGYAYGFHKDTTLALMALSNALLSRDIRPDETILHSDNGPEFTSIDYEVVAEAYKLRRSYSAPGVPYDQAVIESFHATLKKEEVHPNVYESFEEARVRLIYWIEHWYNRTRFHSSLDYLSPVEFEKELAVKKVPTVQKT